MSGHETPSSNKLVQEHQALLERLVQQHNAIAQGEDQLREQRETLLRIMADLGEMHLSAQLQTQNPELELLRAENATMLETITTRDEELNALSQQIGEMEDQLAVANKKREGELADLRETVKERDARIVELEKAQKALPKFQSDDPDIEEYEAELNEFRRQLESDRQLLDQELHQLRQRNQELKEASRTAELELSRERAQLARERMQLDRLREEIRMEIERAQRDAGVRERLQSVQRLKERLGE